MMRRESLPSRHNGDDKMTLKSQALEATILETHLMTLFYRQNISGTMTQANPMLVLTFHYSSNSFNGRVLK